MPIKKIVNCTTGQTIEREMTEEEAMQFAKDQAEGKAEIEAKLARKAAKEALLEKLGITEDEAKLLLSK
jgi:phosphopantetheinyl transferase (holo-ACP synthase)